MRCDCLLLIFTILVTSGFAAQGHAQLQGINDLTTNVTFSDADLARIEAYTSQLTAQLAASDSTPTQRITARAELLEPLSSIRLTPAFRSSYSKSIRPKLRAMIESDDLQAAIMALQITGGLGDEYSLRILEDHLDVQDEPRFQIRLWAARGYSTTLKKGLEQGTIPPRKAVSMIRDLQRAATEETDWFVLNRDLDTLAQIATISSLMGNKDIRDQAVDSQLAVLDAVVQRMKKQSPGPSSLMNAVPHSISRLRTIYLSPTLGIQDKRKLAARMSPILVGIISVSSDHWDSAHVDDQAISSYGNTIHMSQELLRVLDAQVRANVNGAPQTELHDAWNTGDRATFQTGYEAWRDITARPPY
ncbi:MAG: hypothetical protein P8J86_04950 [Phycisphaerales bacterium]|nr:hypothetical protein [Phycisphaerales bacterium]